MEWFAYALFKLPLRLENYKLPNKNHNEQIQAYIYAWRILSNILKNVYRHDALEFIHQINYEILKIMLCFINTDT